MDTTGKRRLLKLADFLEKAKIRGEFDMSTWATAAKKEQPTCGTIGCALGWATAIPSFFRAGLHLATSRRTNFLFEPRFGRSRQVNAGARFFRISKIQAMDLFVPSDHTKLRGKRARKIVARRIRALVKAEAASKTRRAA